MKNIARPVRVFEVEWIEGLQPAGSTSVPAMVVTPTVAVLPFRTIGGTEEDTYFGDGLPMKSLRACR